MGYNKAFFGLYENWFIVLKQELGEDKAIELFTKVMEFGLKKAYDAYGANPGSTKEFAIVVGERDKSVGLRVEFPEIKENKIVYQFLDDPFPNLKGITSFQKIDGNYMKFKVRFLLGENWDYTTTKHKWLGDEYTEHVITKSDLN
jgi:hypothetical protein